MNQRPCGELVVCVQVHDAHQQQQQQGEQVRPAPTLWDTLQYGLNHVGLITGNPTYPSL